MLVPRPQSVRVELAVQGLVWKDDFFLGIHYSQVEERPQEDSLVLNASFVMSGGGYPPRNAAFSGGHQQAYQNHDGMNQFGNAFMHSEQKPGVGMAGKFPPASHGQPQKPLNPGIAQGKGDNFVVL